VERPRTPGDRTGGKKKSWTQKKCAFREMGNANVSWNVPEPRQDDVRTAPIASERNDQQLERGTIAFAWEMLKSIRHGRRVW